MPFRVTNPLAARILADPDLAVALKPFMRGPASVKDLALEGFSLQRAYYRVGLFLKAGLIREVGRRPRRGRPIRLYQAVDRDFRVPVSLIPKDRLEALEGAQSWKRAFEEALAAQGPGYARTLRVFLNPQGVLEFLDEEGEEPPTPVLNLWSAALYLTPEEAQAFRQALLDLYARYAQGQAQGRRRHLLHLGLVPALG